MLTIEDVAARLRIHRATVTREITRGHLAAIKVGGAYRITEDDLDRYIEERKTS